MRRGWLERTVLGWAILAGLWLAGLTVYVLATAEPWAGGGNWGVPFALIVFGLLPGLALFPLALLTGFLASRLARLRR